MKRKGFSLTVFYSIGIALFFVVGFLLLVTIGARTYRDIALGQSRNNQNRALLSYLSTCARANDREEGFGVSWEEEGPVLRIADGGSGFGLRIYQREGRLLEDYGRLDSDLNPDLAQVIGETESFVVEELEPGTYAVTTDAGRVLFHLRSGQESEDYGVNGG